MVVQTTIWTCRKTECGTSDSTVLSRLIQASFYRRIWSSGRKKEVSQTSFLYINASHLITSDQRFLKKHLLIGTTALSSLLQSHPQIMSTSTKVLKKERRRRLANQIQEMHFFDRNLSKGIHWYLSQLQERKENKTETQKRLVSMGKKVISVYSHQLPLIVKLNLKCVILTKTFLFFFTTNSWRGNTSHNAFVRQRSFAILPVSTYQDYHNVARTGGESTETHSLLWWANWQFVCSVCEGSNLLYSGDDRTIRASSGNRLHV